MDKEMRTVGIKMSIMMSVTMSLVLSLVGTLLGGHFNIPSWLISFAVSLIISLLIGLAVPIKKIGDAFCDKCNTDPQSMKGNLLSGIISDIIYTPVITVIMVIVMLKSAAKHAPAGAVPPVSRVMPVSLIVCLIVGYIVIIAVQPLFIKMLTKNLRGNSMPTRAKEEDK